MAALKERVWDSLQIVNNMYGALDQVVDQAKEFCPGILIPVIELDPFKATSDKALVDVQG